MALATTDPVRLPPAPRIPKLLQGVGFVVAREKSVAALARRYGPAFTLNLPIFGTTVVISDPALIKDLFTTKTELVGRAGVLGEMFGPGSTFSLDGAPHRERRKLLVPPFHGKRMQTYEEIVEEEVLRETATWPEGREFETLPSMMRITLNAILRTVFGAEGAALDELRELLPSMVLHASKLAVLPPVVRRDFGPWSPGGKLSVNRQRYDEAIRRLIADIRNDPAFEARTDVLALMLQARYEDGEPISDDHVADELLTLLAAGHETTATTLAWAVERLRRHPRLLARLTAEADVGGSELRQATIWEVQRTRPVINSTARMVKTRIQLGEWVIPATPRRPCQHLAGSRLRRDLPRRGGVQPRPVRRQPARQLRVDSLRRRSAPLHRRRVRQHGDDGHAANPVARVRVRHHLRARRTTALPRCRDGTGWRRAGCGLPATGRDPGYSRK